MKDASLKYKVVRDELTRAIKAGEFAENQRLPAERELAERFGISRMTARRAIEDLAEADLIVRRGGSGSYIRSSTPKRLADLTVHLICMAYDTPISQGFLRAGTQKIEQQGWHPHIIRVQTGYERAALQALRSGEPALVFVNDHELKGPLGASMVEAGGKAVLLGNEVQSENIPCVLSDDATAMRMTLQHLQDKGHHNIALIAGHPESQVESIQVQAWKSGTSPGVDAPEMQRRLIAINPPLMTNSTEIAYHAVLKYLQDEEKLRQPVTTAFISVADEFALGALAACRDAGRPVPGDMSLVNLADSSTAKFAYPPVTCIDIDLERQVQVAFEILEARAMGNPSPYSDRVVRLAPKLIERSSVLPPNQVSLSA